ncbi:hypothetical protein ANANG_G00234740 [Anguilla anguilla]|uniref:WD repeat domain 53 n=1 Tax=Anguilla anguilla TaxID=7936 RepID=A0A9D3RNC7_ANGAN|nr:hypothetical protein ANANG_G00234740 [Anguilla anguilla]
MQLMLWSLQRARPLWVLNLQEVAEEEEGCRQNPGQLFNPPLVHCVSAAACGNVLACAAEDGRVHVVRVGGGSGPERRTALQAHSQGASQAHFLSFLSHPHWLATGGNDGRVALWDVSPRLSISHGAKVNWLCPALLKGEPCLLVADQSSALSVYSLSAL